MHVHAIKLNAYIVMVTILEVKYIGILMYLRAYFCQIHVQFLLNEECL